MIMNDRTMEQVLNHKFIVLAVEHYNTLGLIRSLGEYGIAPIYIAIKGRTTVASKSRYVRDCYYVETCEEGYHVLIEKFGNETLKPFVLSIDDKTTSFMDYRYDELKERFIFFNAGKAGRINQYMDKYKILQIAKKHGLKILDSWECEKGKVPVGISYPVITKAISPVVGGWKEDVHICNSEEELIQAYDAIVAPHVMIQKFIEKKNEYCLDGFCAAKGSLMFNAIESTYNYLIRGYYSPYMTVRNVSKPEIESKLNAMMKEIGFEGICSVEFLIDEDDEYYFSEVNFRNSTWSYAATKVGMPLPVLWAKAMIEGVLDIDAYKTIPDKFTAMVEPIDYGKRVDTGKISAAEWLADYKDAGCLFYYDTYDREPYYEMMKNWEKLK